MTLLSCSLASRSPSYDIEIGTPLLKIPPSYLSSLATRFVLITDNHVLSLYGEKLKVYLSSLLTIDLLSFPPGEEQKNRATKEFLENQLFEKGCGRDTCIIALGGGVVMDIAGYIAATYCRGIPLVMIPTTLLGMVDACIGGKTGVNAPQGKNMLGCIYHPKKIWIDPSLLKTLPFQEIVNGMIEIIKHGLVLDLQLFEYLEAHASELLALDSHVIDAVIYESCRIKKEVVEQDEQERGKRHLLNFGHTVGHALERLSAYSLSHGEAVAIGLATESYLSLEMGLLNPHSFKRIQKILSQYSLPLKLPSRFSLEMLMEALILDKKSLRGKPRFTLLKDLGSPLSDGVHFCTHVEESKLKKALRWMMDDLCCY